MKNNKTIAIVLVLVIAITISNTLIQDRKDQESGVIKIGSISALTGVGSAIGEEERKGAQLAVDEINKKGGIRGRTVELVSEDLSLDKIKNASSIANKLINIDKVVAIVGAQWDEPTQPILPIIESAQIPMVGADNSDGLESEKGYEYFFSTWYDNRVGIDELLRFAESKGLKRISIIKPVAAGFWEFTANEFANNASKYGITIIDNIDMGNPTSLDFKTHISKIKKNNPDAIFIVTSDYNQCVFVKQMKELGLNIPTLGTESSGDHVSLEQCPKLLENRFFSSPKQTDAYKEFAFAFKDSYGEEPKFPSAVTANDAVFVIADALNRTDLVGGAALQKEISKTRIKGSGLENIQFNQKGFVITPEDSFEMMTTKDGVFVQID